MSLTVDQVANMLSVRKFSWMDVSTYKKWKYKVHGIDDLDPLVYGFHGQALFEYLYMLGIGVELSDMTFDEYMNRFSVNFSQEFMDKLFELGATGKQVQTFSELDRYEYSFFYKRDDWHRVFEGWCSDYIKNNTDPKDYKVWIKIHDRPMRAELRDCAAMFSAVRTGNINKSVPLAFLAVKSLVDSKIIQNLRKPMGKVTVSGHIQFCEEVIDFADPNIVYSIQHYYKSKGYRALVLPTATSVRILTVEGINYDD